MNYPTLRQGLDLWNQIQDKKSQLDRVKDFIGTEDVDATAGGITFKIKASKVNVELKAQKNTLKTELDNLQAQFDAL